MAKKVKAPSKVRSTSSKATSQQQQLYFLGGVMVVAIILVIGFILLNRQSAGEALALGENQTYAGIPLGGRYADVRNVERADDVPVGVEQGIDENGIPYIGDPNAPITIAEFADFTCPHCARYSPTMEQLIADYARTGQVLIQFYIIPAQSRAPASNNAANAAACAAEQGGFWEMHDEIFRVHLSESATAFSLDRIEDMANAIGLNGDELRACVNNNGGAESLLNSRREAEEVGAYSTPTVVYRFAGETAWRTLPDSGGEIGGGRPYETLVALIEQANAGS